MPSDNTSKHPKREQAARPDPFELKHLPTAYHPLFYLMLEFFLPDSRFQLFFEYLLHKEPTRLDVVIVQRLDTGTHWEPPSLPGFFSCLGRECTLIEFKGPKHSARDFDWDAFLAKALQYRVHLRTKGRTVPAIDLLLVVHKFTPSLKRRLEQHGAQILPLSSHKGFHRIDGLLFPLKLVETSLAWKQEGEYLLSVFAGKDVAHHPFPLDKLKEKDIAFLAKMMTSVKILRKRGQAMGIPDVGYWKNETYEIATELLRQMSLEERRKTFRNFPVQEIVEALSPEERLKGLPPEEIAKALPPEERLKGLPPEEIAKALPPEILRKIRETKP